MDTGKQPATKQVFNLVREFRGQQLFLASTHSGNGFRWLADRKHAQPFTLDEARLLAPRIAREWGTEPAIIDGDDSVAPVKPAGRLTGTMAIHRMDTGAKVRSGIKGGKVVATKLAHDLGFSFGCRLYVRAERTGETGGAQS